MPASADKPEPAWATAAVWVDRTVEHQSEGGAFCDPAWQACVTNPTSCPWDGDDEIRLVFQGSLAPGAVVATTWCLLADWAEHVSWVRTDVAGVAVTVTVGPVTVTGDSAACVEGPDYDSGSPLLPEVPGSGGGRAALTTVTFTVANVGSRRAQHVYATGGVAPDFGQDHGCTWGPRFGFDPAWTVGGGYY